MDEEIPYNELLVDVDDGIVVGLYHYLWLKDGKGRPCPEVNLPHTIIISNGRPKVWYFTSGKDHCIKRKSRFNINNGTITEALAPPPKNRDADELAPLDPSLTGGLGTWRVEPLSPQPHQRQQRSPGHAGAAKAAPAAGRIVDGTSTGTALGPWPHHGVVARFQGSMTLPHNASGPNGQANSIGRRKKAGVQFELQEESVEWFNREQLIEVLPPGHAVVHGVAALHEGVLQRFVQPRGQHHFSIRATWSPNACVVERRTNKAKLNDPRLPLVDRLSGWDGPNWLSEHTLITGTVLHGSICRLCDNVAAHLADVSCGAIRVLRMVLFFMVDEANRIWLTHCSTLKSQRPKEIAFASPLGGAGGPLQQLIPRARLSGMPLPLAGPAALRLRNPDGGKRGSSDAAGLDLPAPSPAFVASKAAASASKGSGEGEGEEDGDGTGTSGRFLCVLTGEMYPASQRCDVTYKQLLQHWFSLASQLPNEGDRLRAMDTIPLAIRRANPSLTREWYLRVRSQPTFLYRTAPVCGDAAAQITGVALEELQRTLRPAAPSGSGMATVPALVGLPGPGGRGGGGEQGSGTQAGPAPSPVIRQSAVRMPTAAVPARQRPATALGNPPSLPPSYNGTAAQAQTSRPATRQAPAGAMPARGRVTRSKSASPSLMTASRLAPRAGGGAGSGGGRAGGLHGGDSTGSRFGSAAGTVLPPFTQGSGGLPSMLMPRENGAGAGPARGGGGGQGPALLDVYGPTPAQAAEAAAAAAIFPYEVLDEVAQAAGGSPAYPHMTASPTTTGQDPAPEADSGADGVGSSRGNRSPQAEPGDGARPAAGAGSALLAAQSPGLGPAASGGAQWSGGASAPRQTSRRHANSMRMSTSSELTELGSVLNSEPSSPNATHQLQHHHSHGPLLGGGSGANPARMSPPRNAGMTTLQTIHEEGAVVPPPPASAARPHSPIVGAELIFPPPRGSGSHSVPRMRPPTRGAVDRPLPPGVIGGSGRRYMPGAPYAHHTVSGPGNRGLSESGDLPQLPGAGGGSLNSTMASSMGSMVSRRSTTTNTQAVVLSTDDMRTLRELSEAYTAAERLTQQLLAQAHEILSEDGSRPASTGNSPLAAGRRQVSPPGAFGSTAQSAVRPDSVEGSGGGALGLGPASGSGSMGAQLTPRQASLGSGAAAGNGGVGSGGGSAAGSRAGSATGRPSGLPPPSERANNASSLRPSPLGQSQVQVSRQGSGRAGSGGSHDGRMEGQASSVQPLPPVLPRVASGSSSKGAAQAGGLADADSGGGGAGGGGGSAPAGLSLLTSAEADLLAEALQD